jgi:hypothetical protein
MPIPGSLIYSADPGSHAAWTDLFSVTGIEDRLAWAIGDCITTVRQYRRLAFHFLAEAIWPFSM